MLDQKTSYPLFRWLAIACMLWIPIENVFAQQQKQTYQDCSVQWNDSLLILENSPSAVPSTAKKEAC